MAISRRSMLKGLFGLSAAAVAAQFNAPEWMGAEIKEELIADLSSSSVSLSMGGVEPFENRPVWKSVAGVSKVWAEQVRKDPSIAQYLDAAGKALAARIDADILGTCVKMAHEMDDRLAIAEVDAEQQILVDIPKLQNVRHSIMGETPQFQLAMGVEQITDIFGQKKVRVGHLTNTDPQLVNSAGRLINERTDTAERISIIART